MQINVNLQPFTREASAKFRASPCEICGGQSDTEIGFLLRTSVSPFSIIPPTLHNNFILTLLLPEGEAGEAWEHSNKAILFHISNKHGAEEYFNFVYPLL